jgi:hypothetical protein
MGIGDRYIDFQIRQYARGYVKGGTTGRRQGGKKEEKGQEIR